MSGHRSFNELRQKMSPEALARAKAKAERMIREMPLNELKVARDLAEEHSRPAVAKAGGKQ
jgi:hypothetical protein